MIALFSLNVAYSLMEMSLGRGKRPMFIGTPPGNNWKDMAVGSSYWPGATNKLKPSD